MQKRVYLLLLSFFFSVTALLGFVNQNTLSQGFIFSNTGNILSEVFSNNIIINFIVLSFFVFYLMTHIPKKRTGYLVKIMNGLYSMILAVFCNYGLMFRTHVEFNSVNLLIFIIKSISFAVIAFLFLNFIEDELIYLCSVRLEKKDGMDGNHKWLYDYSFILLCWLPYLFILFPGTNNADVTNQLFEFFNHGNWVRDDYPIAWYLVGNHPFTISNQHNFLVTVLYGFNVKIGILLFHSATIGLFLSTVIQVLIMVGIYTYALSVFKNLGMSQRNIRIFKYFFALFPLLPVTTMFLTKNILYTGFLWWSVLLLANAINDKRLFRKIGWNISFVLSVIGQLITQKYAIYVLMLFALFNLAFFWSNKKLRITSIEIVSLITVFFVGQGLMFQAFNIPNGDPIEGEAILIQSTALYQKEHPNDITKDERRTLNNVFVLNNLPKLYNPIISDPVKSSGGKKIGLRKDGTFDQTIKNDYKEGYRYQTVTKEDINAFKKVWVHLMLRHPSILIKAFMNNSYQYLDINSVPANSTVVMASDSFNLHHSDIEIPLTRNKKWIRIESSRRLLGFRGVLATVYNAVSKIPPFMLIINGNLIIMMTIIFAIILLNLKYYKQFGLLLLLISQVPIYMLSPVNGSQRYMYPFLLGVGIIIGLTYCWIKNEQLIQRGRKNGYNSGSHTML